ncbi:MAG TPA: iron export ABC transporter permease subunit FetB [Nitrospirae bacterium]|nr:iron export ABC transporter permease subunit FetB [Nitrospirota bacterium]
MIIDPGFDDLAMTMILFAMVILLSIREGLNIERSLAIATLRTVVQLFFIGYVIKGLFAVDAWYIIVGALLLMMTYAAKAGLGRMKKQVPGLFLPMWVGVVTGSIFTIAVVTGVTLKIDPWYRPDVLIPLGGMILGNAMNGGSIAADRLYSEIRGSKDQIETYLMLGRDYRHAAKEARREAVRAALIPTINAMMTVGLVHLPGMMVGQLLGGVDPVVAAKYQIIIMLMVASSVTVASSVFTAMALKSYFTKNQMLNLKLLD